MLRSSFGALRSIRVRLTIWYVVLLALILGIFSVGVYVALRESLYNNLDDSVDGKAQVILGVVDISSGHPVLSDTDVPSDAQGEQFARVFDSAGNITFDNASANASTPVDSHVLTDALHGGSVRQSLDTQGGTFRVLTMPIEQNSTVIGALQIGLSEGDLHDTLRILLVIIAIAYPLTLIVTSAGGVFLAGRALAPIDGLTRVARQITADDLSQRLDLDLPDDEVGRLARTFNEMIGRLDESFRRQRQFTANASHELRTPLTAIKGQTEVALQRDRDASDYKLVLRSVNSEADRMIRLVGSLLTLARADAGQIPIARDSVDVAGIVMDAAEQVRPMANARDISLQIHGGPPMPLTADEDLLLQLLLNLVENAVKYTPTHGVVKVTWTVANGQATIRVSDTGPGIAAEHLPRIFDRFYRVDEARGEIDGGVGLGLSICRWIAEAHGGTIDVESTAGRGATFVVRLPVPA